MCTHEEKERCVDSHLLLDDLNKFPLINNNWLLEQGKWIKFYLWIYNY